VRISLAILAAGFFATAHAQSLPQASAVPGGIVLLELAPVDTSKPVARFENQRVMIVAANGSWNAVVGLPLALKPGKYSLRTEAAGTATSQTFVVAAKSYPAQHLTVKNKRMVNPEPADLERIQRDQAVLGKAFLAWSEVEAPPLRFALPAVGRLSSSFGLQRYFNGEARQPHSGIDIAAPLGTPVTAPAAGTVVETGDFFFNGNTVLLDHGQGLITMFNHLNRVAVTTGTRVERGQLLGEIGMTGRVTGAHLHWTVSLNNARVDPLLLLDAGELSRLDANAATSAGENPK
jgi:murein DD-endopeptidase MepM/ murein hydrolase activator NlpD